MIGKAKKVVRKEAKELPKKAVRNVEFTFLSPEATKVSLAGAFNSWDTQTLLMKKNKERVWKIEINLAPGSYEYKFLADGLWVENITGIESAPNPFGTRNFLILVK